MMIPENTKKTVKARLLALQGQKAPIDLFLFACLEQEKTLKALSQPPKTKTRRPSFVAPLPRGWNTDFTSPAIEQSEEAFAQAWSECCRWYFDKNPDLFKSEVFDHEILALLIEPAVDLLQDLCRIFKHCYSSDVPPYCSTKDASQANLKEIEIWNVIEKSILSHFKSAGSLIIEYLKWSFRNEVEEEFEPGSRPPVGKYAPPPPRRESSHFRNAKSRDSSRKSPSKERSRGPSSRAENFSEDSKKETGNSKKRHPSSSSSGDFRPSDRRQERSPSRKFDRKPKSGDDVTHRNTEKVLNEVEKALETLRREPSLKEVKLSPQNSFYRRIQHQKIVDAGFISQSVGDGPDRAVTIQRQS